MKEVQAGSRVVVGKLKREDSGVLSLIGLTGLTSITRHLTWRHMDVPSFSSSSPLSKGLDLPQMLGLLRDSAAEPGLWVVPSYV